MRLRTEIVEGELTYTPKGVYHDAMVAHALLRALRTSPDMEHQRRWVEKRADEIMREWGYTDET